MDGREQDGESYILSLSPSDDDWWPELHKMQDMTAEGILLVQESPLLASEGERETLFRTQTSELLWTLKG